MLTRNRKFADSPLEGTGFELPVRGLGWPYPSPRRRLRNRWFAASPPGGRWIRTIGPSRTTSTRKRRESFLRKVSRYACARVKCLGGAAPLSYATFHRLKTPVDAFACVARETAGWKARRRNSSRSEPAEFAMIGFA